jgi:DNA-binding NarL/FixJ family response regulator
LNVLANIVLQEKMQQLAELKDQADREALHHQRRGRPRKYFSQDIQQVIALHEGGMSIRKIAQELKMSPTTVQKLLSMKDVIDWNN